MSTRNRKPEPTTVQEALDIADGSTGAVLRMRHVRALASWGRELSKRVAELVAKLAERE